MRAKKVFQSIGAACAAVLIACSLPLSAQAVGVNGSLNCGGALVQYSTFRWHNPGTWGMAITDNVSTYSRFGMRNNQGLQVTSTLQFNSTGSQSWGYHSGGAYYAINGRMGQDSTACKATWSGSLHI